jgi:hypothetical protein|tara:strand:- start:204 stop:416 length:213 start_codon:yes stop_codon:yes gene_type:complete
MTIKVNLTFKKESKELETALEVVRCLIAIAKNEIKDNQNDKIMKKQSKFELHQLYGVECLLECADFYYKD